MGTTLTQVIPGDDVRTVWVKSDTDLYLVLDSSIADGASIGGTRGHRIAANESYPIPIRDKRPLLASATGTANVTLIGDPL